jgi:hypothetical protein
MLGLFLYTPFMYSTVLMGDAKKTNGKKFRGCRCHGAQFILSLPCSYIIVYGSFLFGAARVSA